MTGMSKRRIISLAAVLSASAVFVSCGGPDALFAVKGLYNGPWLSLGYISEGTGYKVSMAVDPSSGRPVVTYVDGQYGGRVHVMKWITGPCWIDLGFASDGSAGSQFYTAPVTSSAIDPSDNKPVVVFSDGENGNRAHVMKWAAGTNWTDYGFASSDTSGLYASIAVDPSDNNPVVAFIEGGTHRARVVKRVENGSWTDLGYASPDIATHTSIVIDPSDNCPIVAFTEGQYGMDIDRARVSKWSGSLVWTDLGYVSTGEALEPCIVLDPKDNKPIVATQDRSAGAAVIHVLKWNSGTSWIDLGSPDEGQESISLTVDPADGKPVVAFRGGGVYKWLGGTQWTDLSPCLDCFGIRGDSSISIAGDTISGNIYLVLSDMNVNERILVLMFDPTAAGLLEANR